MLVEHLISGFLREIANTVHGFGSSVEKLAPSVSNAFCYNEELHLAVARVFKTTCQVRTILSLTVRTAF